MNLVTEANGCLERIRERLHIKEELKFDEEGSCMVFLDDKILFILELNEDIKGIVFNVVIGNLPKEGREAVLYDLMTANFYWNRTEGGTLSVDEETDIVCLCYMLPFPLENDSDFEVVFEKLANVADYWIDRLKLEKVSLGDDG